MTTTSKVQLFLLFLILGFLTGPRVLALISDLEGSGSLSGKEAANVASAQSATAATPVRPRLATSSDPYGTLELGAKSVYVWDINAHKKLYSKDEHKVMPLASVTKMMMALVAVETLPESTEITIAPVDLLEEGNTGLLAGEHWKFEDLLRFTLVTSSNDGASAIASVAGAKILGASSSDPFTDKKLFIRKMNEKAAAIGLTQTSFHSESVLDLDSVTSGAYGTSRDMAVLFEYILHKHPELFTPTTYSKIDVTSDSNIIHRVANTNAGVAAVTGIIGSKTGYTDLAGGNLVVVVDIGIDHPVVIAVLGSTREGRFTDVEKLIGATVKKIADIPEKTSPKQTALAH
jgi:D-alanyl-D-alanine carboxypeptidase (penicillin-binding protein 5/6)